MPQAKKTDDILEDLEAKEAPKEITKSVVHSFKPQEARLRMGRVKASTHARRHLFADITAGTEPATLLDPGYWAHYAREMRPLDLIECLCEDGSWEGLFRVMFVSTAEVRLSPIYIARHTDGAGRVESDIWEVVWVSPSVKYAVRRKDTGTTIKDHLFPESAAYNYLRQHLAEMRS